MPRSHRRPLFSKAQSQGELEIAWRCSGGRNNAGDTRQTCNDSRTAELRPVEEVVRLRSEAQPNALRQRCVFGQGQIPVVRSINANARVNSRFVAESRGGSRGREARRLEPAI